MEAFRGQGSMATCVKEFTDFKSDVSLDLGGQFQAKMAKNKRAMTL